jgi:hypothetical protein
MQRHRHQEFLRFLNAAEAAVPAGKLVHCILDTASAQPIGATHKHPKVLAWLGRVDERDGKRARRFSPGLSRGGGDGCGRPDGHGVGAGRAVAAARARTARQARPG